MEVSGFVPTCEHINENLVDKKLKVFSVHLPGETVATITVREFPPRLSFSSQVRVESR